MNRGIRFMGCNVKPETSPSDRRRNGTESLLLTLLRRLYASETDTLPPTPSRQPFPDSLPSLLPPNPRQKRTHCPFFTVVL